MAEDGWQMADGRWQMADGQFEIANFRSSSRWLLFFSHVGAANATLLLARWRGAESFKTTLEVGKLETQ
jgi:hypothetical protein